MKIIHNIKLQEDELTLKGQILETIFEEGEKRCYWRWAKVNNGLMLKPKAICKSKDKQFGFFSSMIPKLENDVLFVWGYKTELNKKIIEYTYKNKGRALIVWDYINELTQNNE